ncbi:MAG: Lrp/AsnC family transcriptional regulator [Actinomycetota bacterium]
MELDRTDQQIVALLQRDGRMTHAAIAEEIHLSPSACLRRVRRLEESGVISGYHAALDRERIGMGTTVFVEISLDSQHENQLDEFEAAVVNVPEVISCHLMAGDFDYLVQVVAADVADYERIHRTQMARLPHVANVKSSFALRGVVERGTIEARVTLGG